MAVPSIPTLSASIRSICHASEELPRSTFPPPTTTAICATSAASITSSAIRATADGSMLDPDVPANA